VLLGTVSVDVSEILHRMLRRERIPHSVLNAKKHQAEAEIVARAGHRGAVTIATNMAGRGTDIVLGEGVRELGGLHVIGSERHDSRRIDRQLRGRCARQGDPGSSRFFISMEDNLMRLFGGERITKILERFGFEDGEEISSGMLTKTIENSQRRVEQEHFGYRKRTLEYDNVMNDQRGVIYGHRNEVLRSENPREILFDHIYRAVADRLSLLAQNLQEYDYPFDRQEMYEWLQLTFPAVGFSDDDLEVDPQDYNAEELAARLTDAVEEAYTRYVLPDEDPEFACYLERQIILNAHDTLWQKHLDEMDYMRTAIRLQQYAQRDPLIEYKKEAFGMFQSLQTAIDEEIAGSLFRSTEAIVMRRKMLQAQHENETTAHEVLGQFAAGEGAMPPETVYVDENGQVIEGPDGEPPAKQEPFRRQGPDVGRNDPCPCGSGRKYKKCCGRN
jgi:preprotein translocase subunit SecA